MASTFSRGAHTMNSMLFKIASDHELCSHRIISYEPMIRKIHRKSLSSDMIRETAKLEAEEVKKGHHVCESDGGFWVPHEKTGIYYPKGQEKVIEDVPSHSGKHTEITWVSYADN